MLLIDVGMNVSFTSISSSIDDIMAGVANLNTFAQRRSHVVLG